MAHGICGKGLFEAQYFGNESADDIKLWGVPKVSTHAVPFFNVDLAAACLCTEVSQKGEKT